MLQQRFLPPDVLLQLRTVELRACAVVQGMMTGLHPSPYRGMSVEFAEYRPYQPGDEPGRIDWKAYARSDRYYIREFDDETNLDATIILDASASMAFGTAAMTKWQYAGTLAACLAYVLQRQQDRIGLVVADEKLRFEHEHRNTRGHLAQVIGELEREQPSRKTSLAPVLHTTAAKLKRRGMVILISDLLDDADDIIDALRRLQFNGHDVLVFQTLDRAELEFTFKGPALFEDPESQLQIKTMSEDVRTEYLARLHAFLDQYAQILGKTNITYTLVDTSQPLDAALLAFLQSPRRK